MGAYSVRAVRLEEQEYNYLLPALRNKIGYSGGQHFVIVDDTEELEGVMTRLTGLYDRFEDLPDRLVWDCFKGRTLEPFREAVRGSAVWK